MTMSRNKNIIELKNIGKKISGRLNEVGIISEDDLRLVWRTSLDQGEI